MIWLFLIPAISLFVGLADLPIGYYTFMRIIVFIASCILVHINYKERNTVDLWVVLFALIAILFNPIFPIYLHDKDLWAILDIICAVIYIVNGAIYYYGRKIAA